LKPKPKGKASGLPIRKPGARDLNLWKVSRQTPAAEPREL